MGTSGSCEVAIESRLSLLGDRGTPKRASLPGPRIDQTRRRDRRRRAALASLRLIPLIEDLAKRVDIHDAVIAHLVQSSGEIVESPRKAKSRPIAFTADIESAQK